MKRKPRKKLLYFVKRNSSYVSGNGKPEKAFYISGNLNFLYFQEMKLCYILGKEYSEP